MKNKELIRKYRKQFLAVHATTVSIVSVAEIMLYFIFVYFGRETLSFGCKYLWSNVFVPICINIMIHLIARVICKSDTDIYRLKNYYVVYAAVATSFVVSIFHRDYIVTACAYVFPIILSAMYNDKIILRRSLWMSLSLITVTVVTIYFEGKLDFTMLINALAVYGIIAVSYLSGELSVRFLRRNFSLIEEQALKNSMLEMELGMDQMTGLYNHASFYKMLDAAIGKYKTDGVKCCLAMVDIDDFKKVNDTYGHNAGDVVIRTLADVLKSQCDNNTYAFRYGGEEFAIILSGKTAEEAADVIYEIMELFSEISFSFTKKRITFSTGIASYSSDESREALFDRADENLYYSKKNGKNRITF